MTAETTEPMASSATAAVLEELQLYGYRPFADEPDPRPLPEADAPPPAPPYKGWRLPCGLVWENMVSSTLFNFHILNAAGYPP